MSNTEISEPRDPHIGTLNESSLHAALKDAYSEPGDAYEVPLDGFVIDICRKDLLIEIQTGSFAAMGKKLDHLLPEHRILLVYPIAIETTLVREERRRRSPKRGTIYSLLGELVSIPTLLDHPNLSLEVVLAKIDAVQVHDPKIRRRRGGYRTVDRQLTEIVERHRFDHAEDLLRLLPTGLPHEFTTADLAAAGGFDRSIAQQMAYCFRALHFFDERGRTKAGIHYRLAI